MSKLKQLGYFLMRVRISQFDNASEILEKNSEIFSKISKTFPTDWAHPTGLNIDKNCEAELILFKSCKNVLKIDQISYFLPKLLLSN